MRKSPKQPAAKHQRIDLTPPPTLEQKLHKASCLPAWQEVELSSWDGEPDCTICLEPLAGTGASSSSLGAVAVLSCCGKTSGNAFHPVCLAECYKPPPSTWPPSTGGGQPLEGHLTCVLCRTVHGTRTGDAPAASSRLDFLPGALPDSGGVGYFQLSHSVPDGKQTTQHPKPGERFFGKQIYAYIPGTNEGTLVMWRLLEALRRRLLLTIGQSASTGRDDVSWLQHPIPRLIPAKC